MKDPIRISPQETWDKINDESAFLVCAYDDDNKFKQVHLKGAISLTEFKSKLSSVPKEKEIIFYCA